jgi:hypothetical protein
VPSDLIRATVSLIFTLITWTPSTRQLIAAQWKVITTQRMLITAPSDLIRAEVSLIFTLRTLTRPTRQLIAPQWKLITVQRKLITAGRSMITSRSFVTAPGSSKEERPTAVRGVGSANVRSRRDRIAAKRRRRPPRDDAAKSARAQTKAILPAASFAAPNSVFAEPTSRAAAHPNDSITAP